MPDPLFTQIAKASLTLKSQQRPTAIFEYPDIDQLRSRLPVRVLKTKGEWPRHAESTFQRGHGHGFEAELVSTESHRGLPALRSYEALYGITKPPEGEQLHPTTTRLLME